MPYYFEKPTQVVFWDEANVQYQAGIAYRDEIICACCGCQLTIQEIINETPAEVLVPIYVFDIWIDLSEEICPEDFDFVKHARPYGINNDNN